LIDYDTGHTKSIKKYDDAELADVFNERRGSGPTL
jgi:hypothetical protein